MEKRDYLIILYDYYGELLTPIQQKYFEYCRIEDAEIVQRSLDQSQIDEKPVSAYEEGTN